MIMAAFSVKFTEKFTHRLIYKSEANTKLNKRERDVILHGRSLLWRNMCVPSSFYYLFHRF